MATLQQVLDALTAQIRLAVPLAPAAGGYPYVCYSGWVTQDDLKNEVAKGVRSHIAVYDLEVERNTTRFLPEWQTLAAPTVTLTASAAAGVITFGGTPAAGLNVGVTVGNRPAIAYQTTAGDTSLALVAQHVAAAINAAAQPGVSATVNGASISVTGGDASVAVGGTGTITRQLEQIEKYFLISVWAPAPDTREAIAELIRPAFAALNFVPLGDGFNGRLKYVRTKNHEPQFNAQVFRRDLVYSVEFSTTETDTATQIVGIQETLTRRYS